jgi:hypothetical protein
LLLCAHIGAVLLGGALAGCGFGNGAGSIFVDPGKFESYRCADLVARWKTDNDREKELRNLMDKAAQAPGGSVIGTVTYRSDYESILTEKRMLQQQAAEKNCELTATYQSDQGVH